MKTTLKFPLLVMLNIVFKNPHSRHHRTSEDAEASENTLHFANQHSQLVSISNKKKSCDIWLKWIIIKVLWDEAVIVCDCLKSGSVREIESRRAGVFVFRCALVNVGTEMYGLCVALCNCQC